MPLAQRPSERIDVHPQIAFLDERAGPDNADQIILADNLADAFHQRDQKCVGAAPEWNLLLPLEQEFLRPKADERYRR